MANVQEYSNGNLERLTTAALVMDSVVLGQVVEFWDKGIFASPACNWIGNKCVEHYQKHRLAPKKGIQSFIDELSESPDSDFIEQIEIILRSASREFTDGQNYSSQRLIEIARNLSRENRLKRMAESVLEDLEAKRLDKAESRVVGYTRLEAVQVSGIDLFVDSKAVLGTFSKDQTQSLVEYPDGLGEFFLHSLERDSFIAFAGPQKSAKTYMLVDLSWRAMVQRKKVAFFEVGDLTERQLKERFLVRAARRPIRSPTGTWPCTVRWPTGIAYPEEDDDDCPAGISTKSKEFSEPLNGERAWLACQRVMKEEVRSSSSYYRHACYPNNSISALGIKATLERWQQRDGWTPDVLAIDYADLLAPINKTEKTWDRVNETWKILSALRQELNCLLVTATQVKATGFKKRWLDRDDFSEDNRKLSHVTGMVGINIGPMEKEIGVFRLNWIVKREGEYHPKRGCHVAGCLALANPCVQSVFRRERVVVEEDSAATRKRR